MAENGLYVMNTDTETWMSDQKRKPSNLDLAFTSEDISGRVAYRQSKDTWGSDHFPIIFTVKFEKKYIARVTID